MEGGGGGSRALQHLGVINWGKDSRTAMEGVGSVGRCSQAFMNMGFKFMRGICEGMPLAMDFLVFHRPGQELVPFKI